MLSYVAIGGNEGSLNTAWQERGSTITTPANAATLHVYLYTYNTSGWAAFDNVRLSKPSGETIKRSSYGIAGQVIATHVTGDPVSGNNGLYYFYSDHVGSSSALQKPNNVVIYTWYLPAAGRFISADTIVPDPMNPQQYNRYSYVLNNALRFTDPSGHSCDNPSGDNEASTCIGNANAISQLSGGLFTLDLTNWEAFETTKLLEAVQALISGLGDDLELLSALIGGQSVAIHRDLVSGLMSWHLDTRSIRVYDDILKPHHSQDAFNWGFAHEVGHIVETTFASATDFMAATGGYEALVGYNNSTNEPIYNYFPGELDTSDERIQGRWASNAHRGPSEDWAETFANLTVCSNCVAPTFWVDPPGARYFGQGMVPGGNGPGPNRVAYYNSVLEQAIDPLPGGR